MRNVADKEQVKKSEKKEKWKYRQEKEDLVHLLRQPQFRRYVWRWLSYCNIFASIWRPSAEIHRLAGRQEMGQDMLNEILGAEPDAFVTMIKENQQQKEEEQDGN